MEVTTDYCYCSTDGIGRCVQLSGRRLKCTTSGGWTPSTGRSSTEGWEGREFRQIRYSWNIPSWWKVSFFAAQENLKIQAIRLNYDIRSLGERLKDLKLRFEFEEQNTKHVDNEVAYLRKRISDLKMVTFNLTKGCPISSFEVRPHKFNNSSSSNMSDTFSMSGGDTATTTHWPSLLTRHQTLQMLAD